MSDDKEDIDVIMGNTPKDESDSESSSDEQVEIEQTDGIKSRKRKIVRNMTKIETVTIPDEGKHRNEMSKILLDKLPTIPITRREPNLEDILKYSEPKPEVVEKFTIGDESTGKYVIITVLVIIVLLIVVFLIRKWRKSSRSRIEGGGLIVEGNKPETPPPVKPETTVKSESKPITSEPIPAKPIISKPTSVKPESKPVAPKSKLPPRGKNGKFIKKNV